MTRKSYYYILSVCCCLMALGPILTIFFLRDMGIRIIVGEFETLLILFILIIETLNANKVVKIVNSILLPIILLGFMVVVMHWPFTNVFLMTSITLMIIVILGLFVSNFKNVIDRRITYLILLVPLCRMITILLVVFHYRGLFFLWFLDFITLLSVGVVLAVRLFKMREISK